ncbi:hypothetical protein FQN60_004469 [Etheostoma spectabile]|uniref:Uncharacterized protein n=1 Tax=Etheostoma spectabile TaxID=54343 RepID=A0A5J5CZQ0_9PERO|nr:hypothetical protein FQN60_004469 [Etheostoma spectabile]
MDEYHPTPFTTPPPVPPRPLYHPAPCTTPPSVPPRPLYHPAPCTTPPSVPPCPLYQPALCTSLSPYHSNPQRPTAVSHSVYLQRDAGRPPGERPLPGGVFSSVCWQRKTGPTGGRRRRRRNAFILKQCFYSEVQNQNQNQLY